MFDYENNNFDVEALKKMGIHSLRSLARSSGVKSPTTLKKEELIDNIIKIKNKEIQPTVNKLGRKPKDSVLSTFDFSSNGDIFAFHSPCASYDSASFETSGSIGFNSNTDPILKIKEDSGRAYNIPISQFTLNKYGLKKDDILEVELRYVENALFKYCIDRLITINGIDAEKYNKDSFVNLPNGFNITDTFVTNFDISKITNGRKLLKGQSYFFYASNKAKMSESCYNIATALFNDNTNIFVLNCCSNYLGFDDYKNISLFNLDICKPFDELCNELTIIQEKVKNLVIDGNEVVFIINELEEVLRTINYNITKSVTDIISPDAITYIRRLFLMSKYITKTQSLTIISTSTLSSNDAYRTALIDNVINHTYYFTLPKNK